MRLEDPSGNHIYSVKFNDCFSEFDEDIFVGTGVYCEKKIAKE